MVDGGLGRARAAGILGLAGLTLGVGLGSAGRLTYHEAFVAQAAREMIASGDVLVPTVGGLPWLEKPPLAFWLVALAGRAAGEVTETVARLPSALAGALLALGVAVFAARRFGATAGLLAGLIQATTVWTVLRGRLAEVDMLLACLVTWTLVAFDRLRTEDDARFRPWRWAFFVGIGLTNLAKGIGFGAVLVLATATVALAWDRDLRALRRLRFGAGWALAAALGLTWPALVVWRHPAAWSLWTLHVSDRLASHPEHFIGSTWSQYVPSVLAQLLPWAPLALLGAGRSLGRAFGAGGPGGENASPSPEGEGDQWSVRPRRAGGDRALWAWAAAPLGLLSLATVKNPHYAIHALPPCSVWAALALIRLGARLHGRGLAPRFLRRVTLTGFAGLGLACALGFAVLAPRYDRRGAEWAFYEAAGARLRPNEPLVLLYDDWDRQPYPSPFGPVPHDLGVRLYYLRRPATVRTSPAALLAEPPTGSFAVLGRDRDLPALRRLGTVETLARGPTLRARASRVDDRTFRLFRVERNHPQMTQIDTDKAQK